jgi:hypothetical protein
LLDEELPLHFIRRHLELVIPNSLWVIVINVGELAILEVEYHNQVGILKNKVNGLIQLYVAALPVVLDHKLKKISLENFHFFKGFEEMLVIFPDFTSLCLIILLKIL